MHAWRLSILTPATRVDAARRTLARQGPLLAAAGGLGLAMILGWIAPAPLVPVSLTLIGMAGIAGLGLLAYLFARLTVAPLADPREAALAASLVPAACFPGIGPAALAVPAILAIWLGWKRPAQRVVALMVQCGAILALAGAATGDLINHFIFATTHGTALFFLLNTLDGSANDNPSMERTGAETWLPRPALHARSMRIPESGSGE